MCSCSKASWSPPSPRTRNAWPSFDVFDFELGDDDIAKFAVLEDPSFPHIFGHLSTKTVSWPLEDYVKEQQLVGATPY